jgi:hypothetical protein
MSFPAEGKSDSTTHVGVGRNERRRKGCFWGPLSFVVIFLEME